MDSARRFWNLERGLVALYLVAAAGAYLLAGSYRDNSGRLPRLIAAVIVVLTAYLLAGQYLRWRRSTTAEGSGAPAGAPGAPDSSPTTDPGPTISAGQSLAFTAGFLLAAYLVGFELAILAFTTVTSRRLGLTWARAALFGVVFSAVLWVFFDLLLRIVLPQGALFTMF